MKYILIVILGYPQPGGIVYGSTQMGSAKACLAALERLKATAKERRMGDFFGYCVKYGE